MIRMPKVPSNTIVAFVSVFTVHDLPTPQNNRRKKPDNEVFFTM